MIKTRDERLSSWSEAIGSSSMKETKFKQTEVGMIPCDWEVLPIKGLCTKVTDGSHESPKEVDNGYYMPSVKDMTDLGFCFSDCKQISKNDYLKLERNGCRPEKDDVLIAKDGSILKYAFVMDDELPIVILSSIAILRPNKKKIDSHYFAHYFKKEDFVNKVLSDYKTGTGVPRIVLNNFKEIEIAYPRKIEEQQRVANALSDVDTLIANLEKLIAKKKNIKQGAMQQLLTGRKRLPGFSKPWIDKKLGEGLKFQCGAPFQSTYFNREHQGVRLIKNRDLKSDDQIYYYDGEYTYDYIVKNGNLLVGMDGDFMPCLWNKGTALLNQRVGRILTNCWSLPYLYYILIKPLLEKQDGTGATTVKHLSHRDVENMVVYMTTDIQEQTAIANVLSDMDTEIATLETKLAKYRTLKIGMMQQLLTGKIRLV